MRPAHRVGRLWIRCAGTSTYDVMFCPTGTGDRRVSTEDGLRALLRNATISEAQIDEAVTALRIRQEYEIPDVSLSLERLGKLGL